MSPLLRATDVAKILRCSDANVYNLTRSGSLRAVRFKAFGDRWTYRYRPEDVEEFIQNHLSIRYASLGGIIAED
jgi:excisionase family DNA binding protein